MNLWTETYPYKGGWDFLKQDDGSGDESDEDDDDATFEGEEEKGEEGEGDDGDSDSDDESAKGKRFLKAQKYLSNGSFEKKLFFKEHLWKLKRVVV